MTLKYITIDCYCCRCDDSDVDHFACASLSSRERSTSKPFCSLWHCRSNGKHKLFNRKTQRFPQMRKDRSTLESNNRQIDDHSIRFSRRLFFVVFFSTLAFAVRQIAIVWQSFVVCRSHQIDVRKMCKRDNLEEEEGDHTYFCARAIGKCRSHLLWKRTCSHSIFLLFMFRLNDFFFSFYFSAWSHSRTRGLISIFFFLLFSFVYFGSLRATRWTRSFA